MQFQGMLEEELRAEPSNQDLFRLVDDSFDLITLIEIKDGVSKRLYSSRSHETILGHASSACNGDTSKLIHLHAKDFLQTELPMLVNQFEAGKILDGHTGELKLLHVDGRQMPFEYRISLNSDRPSQFVCTFRDISDRIERQRFEDERQSQQAKLELFRLIDTSFDLVSLIEVHEGVSTRIYSSESHRIVLDHDPVRCNGDVLTLAHLYVNEFLLEVPQLNCQFNAGAIKDGHMGELELLHADGHRIPFEYRISINPVRPHQFLCTMRDITDRLERQRLELDRQRLEVERRKDEDAVHTISHQLKNRFIALKGLAQSLHGSIQDYACNLLDRPHNVSGQ